MQAMTIVRDWQFDVLHRSIKVISHILTTTPAEDLVRFHDGGDGWSVVQIICHLRDWDQLFLDRVKLILSEDMPDLPNPNPDEAAAAGHYQDQNIQAAFETWAKNRAIFIVFLEKLDEDDWERAGMHPRRGHFTITDQLFLTAWHDSLHIEQMIKVLNQRLTAPLP